MTIEDYEDAALLWHDTEGIGLHDDSDSKEAIAAYLERNSGLSFVTRQGDKLVGAILSWHDGRRGFILAKCVRIRKMNINHEDIKLIKPTIELKAHFLAMAVCQDAGPT